MLSFDYEESVGYWVCMASHALRRAMDAELARENITLRQWEVLAWIAIDGEQSQAKLAERLGIEPPTLAGVLNRMERDGWLERSSCQEDRRRKRVHPTEKAESLWTRMVECAHRVRAHAVRGISADDLATFKRVCAQLRANLGDPEDTARADASQPILTTKSAT